MLFELTKRDFQTRYVKNWLGIIWAIIEPLAFMFILAFVFGIGLRSSRDMNGIPFIAYLITGLNIHLFFSNTLSSSSTILRQNSFLIRRVNFNVTLLPFIKILSNVFLQLILVLVMSCILLLFKVPFSPHWFWFLYYLLCASCLLMGLSLIVSAVSLFVPDIAHIVVIAVRLLFYLSPVIWQIDQFPEKFHFYLKLNPMYYIITGYQNSFLFHKGIWQEPRLSIYFWGLTLFFVILGFIFFNKTKPYFADEV